MKIIGTAGHVDHGKSTLVQALTGMNPDRLEEEKKREMTIDLGFAWMRIPGDETVGIIDVPGHRDFIENMLAGVGGIDAVLFVIAADEGIMPQTREHLAIVDLLQIEGGVIALTKVDLVEDQDWLSLVQEEISRIVKGTVLENAEIVSVSAKHNLGIDALRSAIQKALQNTKSRLDRGKPRLPIDRVFSIAGFGTVVTGTLDDGSLHTGDAIEILPTGLHGRIRGLQSYKEKTEILAPGTRAAVNITGIESAKIKRGDTLCFPGQYLTTKRLDVRFNLLKDAQKPLSHNDSVKLFLGTSEVIARVRVLGAEEVEPGNSGYLQLDTREPIVGERGDRFILRRPSPGETLGGGTIMEAHPVHTDRRFNKDLIARLETIAKGSPRDIIQHVLDQKGALTIDELIQFSGLQEKEVDEQLQDMLQRSQLQTLSDKKNELSKRPLICTPGHWQNIKGKIVQSLKVFHQNNPLKIGMLKEELRSRLGLDAKLFSIYISKAVDENILAENGASIQMADHTIQYSQADELKVDRLKKLIADAPFSPPSIKELKEILGDDLYRSLIDNDQLIPVSEDVAFSAAAIDDMKQRIIQVMEKNQKITVGEVRDLLGTSRKYALAILEYLDVKGITKREGDFRRLMFPNR